MKIKKTDSFAFWTSIFITVLSALSFYVASFFIFNTWLKFKSLLLFIAIVFPITFAIVQYAIKKFIFKRINSIYENVRFLDDSNNIKKFNSTSDLDELSDEVQKFAKIKQQQIKKLTLQENYRRDYLGNISHELKTPLFTVQGYLLTLEDGAMDDKKIRKKYLERASKGVERLISIVKDLDLISKLESADLTLNKRPFDIIKLINDTIDLLEMEAKKRNISLLFDKHYEYPIMVIADEERVEQVLTNLIVNSIKYGKINGTTVLGVSSFNDNEILVTLKDNGEGMKEEHQKRIFERFYRIDQSRSRDQGGSGLGLSIVKHIIEAHDQQIFVKSEYMRGSEFSFTLEKVEKF